MDKLQSFSVEQAVRYGLTEAVLLMCLATWRWEELQKEASPQDKELWLSRSTNQFLVLCPYFSPYTIRMGLERLQNEGLLTIQRKDEAGMLRRKLADYQLTAKGRELMGLC